MTKYDISRKYDIFPSPFTHVMVKMRSFSDSPIRQGSFLVGYMESFMRHYKRKKLLHDTHSGTQ